MAEIVDRETIAPLLDDFDAWAVTSAEPADKENWENRYRSWLCKGYAAGMEFLKKHAQLKLAPEELLPGCRSLIMVLLNYNQDSRPSVKGEGLIARYARGRDYHKAMRTRLRALVRELEACFPKASFRHFTDSTPLWEKHYAWKSGIGLPGFNSLLINRELGSYFVLGGVMSTMPFSSGGSQSPAADFWPACTDCRACLAACPCGALKSPFELDAGRCLAYLSIEYKGVIAPELANAMGSRLFGCDVCQEVCPANRQVPPTMSPDFLDKGSGAIIDLERILAMGNNSEAFRERFAGSVLMRAGLFRLQRNACIVAANQQARSLRPLIENLVSISENPVVSAQAQAALRTL